MTRLKKLEYFILVVTHVFVIEVQAMKQAVKDPKFYFALYGPVLSGPQFTEIANELVRMEQYEFALEIFDKVIEKNPSEISYYDHRAVCYSLMGPEYLDMAWSEFKKTVDSGKESKVLDATAFENLAIRLYENENYAQAKWCYSEAIRNSGVVEKEESSSASFYLMRGICNLMVEDLEAANTDLKEAAAQMKESASIEEQERLQEALYKFGRWEKAVQNSLILLDDTVLDGLGKKFKESKKFEEAVHCYDEAIERDPENMDFYQKRAQCHMGMKNVDLAVKDFKTRLDRNIHDTGYWHSLIEALFSVEKFQEALKETEILEEIELRWLARKFMMSEKFVDALRLYDEGVRRYASEVESYTARAECHRRMKNYNEEIRDLKRAVNLDSDLRDSFVDKLIWYGMFEMAFQEVKFLEEPKELFDAGSGFFRYNKFNEAVHCYTEAITKDPANFNFYYQRGLGYFKMNKFNEAIADFKESLEKSPGEVSPRVYLTEALIEVNENEQAEKVFEKVLSMSKIPANSSHHWYRVQRKLKNLRPRGPAREIKPRAPANDMRSTRDIEQLQALLLQTPVG